MAPKCARGKSSGKRCSCHPSFSSSAETECSIRKTPEAFLAKKLNLRLTSDGFKAKFPFYRLAHQVLNALRVVFSLDWIYAIARWLFARLSDIAGFFRQVLEGEAGVLWSLFFLLMMAILIYTQVGQP